MLQLGLAHERVASALYFGITLSRERLVVPFRTSAPLHERATGDLQLRRGFELSVAFQITKKAEEPFVIPRLFPFRCGESR